MSSVVRRLLLPGALLACLLVAVSATGALAAAPAGGASGAVRFVKVTSSSFDHYTSYPDALVPQDGQQVTFSSWMRSKFWRSIVYEPYFDDKTSWYDRGWLYKDAYALYNPSQDATDHADWILRDAQGSKLYIPWGCSGGTCPQYAADVGNPAYRAWFVQRVRGYLAHGYKGLYLDDVNLDFRVGNGNGDQVVPMDPRTGQPMTETAWRGYFATLTEDLRAAFPDIEIVHNSVWYAGGAQRDADPAVQRQIAAADVINLERGANDGGLTGGTGQWSLNALLSFVDRVHAAGRSVNLDGYDSSAQGREYNLGAYFLISAGRDSLGNSAMAPDTWWSMYDVDLGLACGPRVSLGGGLLRRDFTGGTVYVGDPGATTRSVTLDRPMTDETGATVGAVSVGPRSAAILRGATGCTPTENPAAAPAPASSTPAPPLTQTPVPPAPTARTTTTVKRPAKKTTTAPRVRIKKVRARMTRRTTARAARAARPVTVLRGSVLVTGAARGLGGRTVTAVVQSHRHGRWVAVRVVRVAAGRGSFSVRVTGVGRGAHRVVVRAGRASDARRFRL